MGKEKLLTVREVATYFKISEKAVVDLSQEGIIPAYKVGGAFLRFKEDQLRTVKITPKMLSGLKDSSRDDKGYSGYRNPLERINDFLFYNNFYFLCFIISLGLLFIVFYT